VLNERYFEAGDLLEVISFGLADLPYRFIYFSLSDWRAALTLFVIKFSYKVGHILDIRLLDHHSLQETSILL
jgi:hypothetical protein